MPFIGEVPDGLAAKTAAGIADWRKEWYVGQLRLEGCKAGVGLSDMTIGAAKDPGTRTMVIGVVNAGGVAPGHWIASIVEAQGSILHPSFTGDSSGLLHGAQPDAFVVCHEPTRTKICGVETPLPSIDDVIETTIRLGKLTNPEIQPVGLAVTTATRPEVKAQSLLRTYWRTCLPPAVAPVRCGAGAIAEPIISRFAP